MQLCLPTRPHVFLGRQVTASCSFVSQHTLLSFLVVKSLPRAALSPNMPSCLSWSSSHCPVQLCLPTCPLVSHGCQVTAPCSFVSQHALLSFLVVKSLPRAALSPNTPSCLSWSSNYCPVQLCLPTCPLVFLGRQVTAPCSFISPHALLSVLVVKSLPRAALSPNMPSCLSWSSSHCPMQLYLPTCPLVSLGRQVTAPCSFVSQHALLSFLVVKSLPRAALSPNMPSCQSWSSIHCPVQLCLPTCPLVFLGRQVTAPCSFFSQHALLSVLVVKSPPRAALSPNMPSCLSRSSSHCPVQLCLPTCPPLCLGRQLTAPCSFVSLHALLSFLVVKSLPRAALSPNMASCLSWSSSHCPVQLCLPTCPLVFPGHQVTVPCSFVSLHALLSVLVVNSLPHAALSPNMPSRLSWSSSHCPVQLCLPTCPHVFLGHQVTAPCSFVSQRALASFLVVKSLPRAALSPNVHSCQSWSSSHCPVQLCLPTCPLVFLGRQVTAPCSFVSLHALLSFFVVKSLPRAALSPNMPSCLSWSSSHCPVQLCLPTCPLVFLGRQATAPCSFVSQQALRSFLVVKPLPRAALSPYMPSCLSWSSSHCPVQLCLPTCPHVFLGRQATAPCSFVSLHALMSFLVVKSLPRAALSPNMPSCLSWSSSHCPVQLCLPTCPHVFLGRQATAPCSFVSLHALMSFLVVKPLPRAALSPYMPSCQSWSSSHCPVQLCLTTCPHVFLGRQVTAPCSFVSLHALLSVLVVKSLPRAALSHNMPSCQSWSSSHCPMQLCLTTRALVSLGRLVTAPCSFVSIHALLSFLVVKSLPRAALSPYMPSCQSWSSSHCLVQLCLPTRPQVFLGRQATAPCSFVSLHALMSFLVVKSLPRAALSPNMPSCLSWSSSHCPVQLCLPTCPLVSLGRQVTASCSFVSQHALRSFLVVKPLPRAALSPYMPSCQSWSSSHCPMQLCLPTCPLVFLGRQVPAPCSFVSLHAPMSFLVVKSLPRAALSPYMPCCLSWSSSHCPVQLCLTTRPLVSLGRQVTAPCSFVSQHALLSVLVVKSLPRAALSPYMPSSLSWSSSHCPMQLCLHTCPLVFLGRQATAPCSFVSQHALLSVLVVKSLPRAALSPNTPSCTVLVIKSLPHAALSPYMPSCLSWSSSHCPVQLCLPTCPLVFLGRQVTAPCSFVSLHALLSFLVVKSLPRAALSPYMPSCLSWSSSHCPVQLCLPTCPLVFLGRQVTAPCSFVSLHALLSFLVIKSLPCAALSPNMPSCLSWSSSYCPVQLCLPTCPLVSLGHQVTAPCSFVSIHALLSFLVVKSLPCAALSPNMPSCLSWSSSYCPVQLCLPTCPLVFLGRQVTAPCSFISPHALLSVLVVKSLPRAALSPNTPSCLSWSSSHCPVQLCLTTRALVSLGRLVTAPCSFVSIHALLSFLVVKSLPRAALSPYMPSCQSWSSSHCLVQLCLPTRPQVFLGRQATAPCSFVSLHALMSFLVVKSLPRAALSPNMPSCLSWSSSHCPVQLCLPTCPLVSLGRQVTASCSFVSQHALRSFLVVKPLPRAALSPYMPSCLSWSSSHSPVQLCRPICPVVFLGRQVTAPCSFVSQHALLSVLVVKSLPHAALSHNTPSCQSWSSSHCPMQLCLPTCPLVFLGRQVPAPCSFVSQHALMSFLVVKSLPRAALSPYMPPCLSWSSSHCPVQLCLPTCPHVFLGRQVTAPCSFVSLYALLSFLVVKSLPRAALSPNTPSCQSWSSSHCPVQLCLPTRPLVSLGRQVTAPCSFVSQHALMSFLVVKSLPCAALSPNMPSCLSWSSSHCPVQLCLPTCPLVSLGRQVTAPCSFVSQHTLMSFLVVKSLPRAALSPNTPSCLSWSSSHCPVQLCLPTRPHVFLGRQVTAPCSFVSLHALLSFLVVKSLPRAALSPNTPSCLSWSSSHCPVQLCLPTCPLVFLGRQVTAPCSFVSLHALLSVLVVKSLPGAALSPYMPSCLSWSSSHCPVQLCLPTCPLVFLGRQVTAPCSFVSLHALLSVLVVKSLPRAALSPYMPSCLSWSSSHCPVQLCLPTRPLVSLGHQATAPCSFVSQHALLSFLVIKSLPRAALSPNTPSCLSWSSSHCPVQLCLPTRPLVFLGHQVTAPCSFVSLHALLSFHHLPTELLTFS